jgi:hypothetical protein
MNIIASIMFMYIITSFFEEDKLFSYLKRYDKKREVIGEFER